ncbi:MAG: hypothetical protein HWN67_04380 [Candidatus Helarchaeota archaeon]|nr:hypothetical protein [Candidatus Helarchaeota archaeon]
MSLFKKIAKANTENQKQFKLNDVTFTVVPRTNSGFSLDDICSFQNAIFNVHELARKRYSKTKSEDDAMIAIDAIISIQEIKKTPI